MSLLWNSSNAKLVRVVSDMNDLMASLIRQNEAEFSQALWKDDIHAVSSANGLTAIHLAVYWPWALQQLIRAGADVNCEDSDHRRPIHLAVACLQVEAVDILLQVPIVRHIGSRGTMRSEKTRLVLVEELEIRDIQQARPL